MVIALVVLSDQSFVGCGEPYTTVSEAQGPEKLKVTFVDTTVSVFGLPLINKEFPEGRSGFWKMTYLSEDLRVLYTNAGNVFVMTSID